MNATSFTESKDDWTALFVNIFNVSSDRIVLQHDNSSNEISVQVRSINAAEKDDILNLMKNDSKFISSIKTEKDQSFIQLKKYKVNKVTQPETSK